MSQSKYTDKASVENYILKDIDAAFDDQIANWILAMSRYIDRYCNRTIWREEEETFKYDGDGSDLMIIKDCIDPVVSIDGVVTEVYKYPTTKEYTSRIVLDDGYKFTKGKQNVEVTGLQCMSLYLPEDIQFACTVLVGGIINNQEDQDKSGTTERIGNYSVTYKTKDQLKDFETAKQILNSYKRIAI